MNSSFKSGERVQGREVQSQVQKHVVVASLGFEIKKGKSSVSRIFIPLFASHLFSNLIKRCRTLDILIFPQFILPYLCFLSTLPRSMDCILNHFFPGYFQFSSLHMLPGPSRKILNSGSGEMSFDLDSCALVEKNSTIKSPCS